MKVLVVGGGVFVGRHIVEAALRRNWDVTVLTRGRHSLPSFGGRVDHVVGDRLKVLSDLTGTWDAVIDTCGYRPHIVADAVRSLQHRTGRYLFISSASVYSYESGTTEDLELPTPLRPEALDPRHTRDYGPLKVACENEVRSVMGNRALILRPGLIVGPYDPSDRFGYWPLRMAIGGEVLAPGKPTDPVQIIDGRDHAKFALACLEAGHSGTYNVAGVEHPLEAVLRACEPDGANARVRWVDSSQLLINRVRPWTEMPLWRGLKVEPSISIVRAQSLGLSQRAMSVTAIDTLQWERNRPEPFPRRSQLSTERELALLGLYG